MLQIKLDKVVNQVVTHEMRNGWKANNALYFRFDLYMSHFVESQDYSQRCGLHLLYHVHPGSSSVDVFSSITDSPFAKINDIKEWKHECSHDSCWRDVGIFSNIYFKMAKSINEAMAASNLEEIAPKDMFEHNSFGSFDFLYKWVPVQIKKNPSDSYGHYRKTIELLE